MEEITEKFDAPWCDKCHKFHFHKGVNYFDSTATDNTKEEVKHSVKEYPSPKFKSLEEEHAYWETHDPLTEGYEPLEEE
jgi:hypothetical protein